MRSLLKSAIDVFASQIVLRFISIPVLLFLTRQLTTSELGVVFLFQAIIAVTGVIIDFGTSEAIEKRISEGESGGILGAGVAIKSVSLLVVLTLSLLFRGSINSYFGATIYPFLVAGLLLREGARVAENIRRGEQAVSETARIDLVAGFGRATTAVGLVVLGFGLYGVLAADLLGAAVRLIGNTARMETRLSIPSSENFKSIFDFSKFNYISRLSQTVYNWMDILMIGFFIGQSAVSVYEVAWRISESVLMFSTAISTALLPKFSDLHSRDRITEISRTVSDLTPITLLLVVPVLFGGLLYSQELLRYAFGEPYAAGAIVLIVLLFDNISGSVNSIYARTLHALDRPAFEAASVVTAAALNLVLNYILIQEFQLIGAAIATAFASLCGDILISYFLTKSIDIELKFGKILWIFVAAIVMVVPLALIGPLREPESIVWLGLAIVSGGVFYFVGLLIYPSLRRDILRTGRTIIGRT